MLSTSGQPVHDPRAPGHRVRLEPLAGLEYLCAVRRHTQSLLVHRQPLSPPAPTRPLLCRVLLILHIEGYSANNPNCLAPHFLFHNALEFRILYVPTGRPSHIPVRDPIPTPTPRPIRKRPQRLVMNGPFQVERFASASRIDACFFFSRAPRINQRLFKPYFRLVFGYLSRVDACSCFWPGARGSNCRGERKSWKIQKKNNSCGFLIYSISLVGSL